MAPNIDAMDTETLHQFAADTRGLRPRTAARRIFGTAKDGRTKAIRQLNAYAWNAITARACRMRGDIETALRYEDICHRIFDTLPEFARW